VTELQLLSIFLCMLIYGRTRKITVDSQRQMNGGKSIFFKLLIAHIILATIAYPLNLSYTGTENIQGLLLLPFSGILLLVDIFAFIAYFTKNKFNKGSMFGYLLSGFLGYGLIELAIRLSFSLAPSLNVCINCREYSSFLAFNVSVGIIALELAILLMSRLKAEKISNKIQQGDENSHNSSTDAVIN
jgi:hypothetical protein